MTLHTEPHPKAYQTVTVELKRQAGPGLPPGTYKYDVEDYWDRVSGGSWMFAEGNIAALNYAMSSAGVTPIDDEVLYGKIGPFGYLVHTSELVSD